MINDLKTDRKVVKYTVNTKLLRVVKIELTEGMCLQPHNPEFKGR